MLAASNGEPFDMYRLFHALTGLKPTEPLFVRLPCRERNGMDHISNFDLYAAKVNVETSYILQV